MAYYDLSLFFNRMILIVEDARQGVGEHCESLLECHAVLGKVGCCFSGIPFEFQTDHEEFTLTRSRHIFTWFFG